MQSRVTEREVLGGARGKGRKEGQGTGREDRQEGLKKPLGIAGSLKKQEQKKILLIASEREGGRTPARARRKVGNEAQERQTCEVTLFRDVRGALKAAQKRNPWGPLRYRCAFQYRKSPLGDLVGKLNATLLTL